ncbi:MAG: T9SS type A sorting domain-containing protein, partial [Bacteroidetes bacterium]|nr:T9SS type A sorting domain-containing protein [Bacteroidota bacterium]
QNGFVLTSSAASGNQWYNQGGLIIGANGKNYTVNVNGDYYVVVTLAVCSSQPSNIISITNVGIVPAVNPASIRIYPNPARNEITIELKDNKQNIRFDIVNSTGKVVFKGSLLEKTVVPTNSFAPGVYMIKLENNTTFKFEKI